MQVNSLKFSGHESFHCRPFWLKKGFDFVKTNQVFNDYAGIELGVGKNMVASIRFWLKSFDIVDNNDQLTELANKLFTDDGWDPFIEDEATLWLLHFNLCAKNYSSIYHLIFSELRKVRPEFTKNHFMSQVHEIESKQSENIVGKDFTVFTRTYFGKPSKDKEESFSGLFTELNLLTELGTDNNNNHLYHISNSKQDKIPWQVILYCIVENDNYSNSISFSSLFTDENGVGKLFAFSQDGLESKLMEISENTKDVVYKNDAGVKELQFKNKTPNGLEILNSYYAK
tara:strand:- start:35447 stop:36301 length:855 start_codon:yes stop_codon:yes gene_type:complete